MKVARHVVVTLLAYGLAWLGGAQVATAHVADTSYARFLVTRDGIESKFSFDFATLSRIARGLDSNGDHAISPAELDAQTAAIYQYLRQHIRFEIGGAAADLGVEQPVAFPPEGDPAGIVEAKYHDAASITHFVFQHALAQPPADFWVQFELFHELGPRHMVLSVIEQDGRKHEVLFRESEPEYLFDTGYEPAREPLPVTAPDTRSDAETARAEPVDRPVSSGQRSSANESAWRQTWQFFELGVEHIFLGYDHILFLLSLLVVSRLGELIKIVTSFTVAHTITLMLATLDVVRLPSRLVESAIAATIVFVAIENFWVRETAHRWRLTFFCGLIHGFGFASVLQELGLPAEGLVRSLVAFNCGVEAGQLIIVLALLPLVTLVARWKYGQQARLVISGMIAICGCGWLIDRVFGLGLMPF